MTNKKFKVKKGDEVIVLAGKDKGKKGEILRVLTEEDRVLVKGINVVTKHVKPSAAGAGGIQKIEKSIHVSNVAHLDPKSGKATRTGYKVVKDNKVRVAKKSGEQID